MLSIPTEHQMLLAPVARVLAEQGVAAWLVGGYVRDLLLGRPGDDIDVAVDGPALPLTRRIADQTGGAFVTLDDATESARIVWKTTDVADNSPSTVHRSSFSLQRSLFTVDLVRLRAPSIEADLRLRDVTINALALPLNLALQPSLNPDALSDPTGGRVDLLQRRVRPCGAMSFAADPLRMLRAVRIAAQLSFDLAPETDVLIRKNAALINNVAQERVRDELLKLLAQRHAARWVSYLDTVRLLTRVIPELEPARTCTQPREHFLPVLDHLLETVRAWEWLYDQIAAQASESEADTRSATATLDQQKQNTPVAVQTHPQLTAPLPRAERIVERMGQPVMAGHRRYALFKLATLLHDVAKPQTKQVAENGRVSFYDHQVIGAEMASAIAQRLRLSRDAVAYVHLVVREHMRPGQLHALGDELTMRAVYRFGRDTGDAAPDVLLHALCDHLAVRGPMLSVASWAHHVAWTGDMLDALWTPQRTAQRARLLTGTDLIRELHLQPGPLIGQILEAVAEAQFLGTIHTRDEALDVARQTLHETHQRAAH